MSIKSPVAILYDENGNPIDVTLDGGVYRLETKGKVLNSAGTQVDPATEQKLEAVRVLLASLEAQDFSTEATLNAFLIAFNAEDFASQTTLQALLDAFNAEDFASEATLAAADAKLATIDAVLDSIKDTDGIKKITDGVQLQAGTSSIGTVKLEDGASTRKAYIDETFRLAVSANVVVPPTSVAVNIQEVSSLNGSDDNVYVIPNGKTITVSRFAGGSEGNSGKVSQVSLYYDPNGNGTGMTLIRTMFLGTTNYEYSLDNKYLGDGTAAIRMRRERLDGSADTVAGFWDGFRDA